MKDDKTEAGLLRVLRKSIDDIDARLIELVSQRMEKVRSIGQIKKQKGLPIVQDGRWSSLMEERLKLAEEQHLSEELTKELFELLAKYSINAQKKIFSEGEDND